MLAIRDTHGQQGSITRREARMLSGPSPVIQSVVRDAAAHRLLSTVESSPEMTMNRKGTSTHAGSRGHDKLEIYHAGVFCLEAGAGPPENQSCP